MKSETTCPLCRSAASRLFDRRKFRDQPVSNFICLDCGLVYQPPRMNAAELEAFYAQEYRRLYQGQAGPDLKDLAVQKARAGALAEFLRKAGIEFQRHLDIGCSAGELLNFFAAQFGSQPVGVEPGDTYREFTRNRGIPVYPSLDELLSAGEARFDLISLAHVLEHLPDPVETLRRLREELLSPQGWLLVEVPNLYAHDSFEVAHLVSYSPHTLRQTLQQSGFQMIRLEAHGRPRSQLLPLYLTALARPAAQPEPGEISPDRLVGWKRRLGMLRRRVLSRLLPHRAWLPPVHQPSD